jgi:hypothetical protein
MKQQTDMDRQLDLVVETGTIQLKELVESITVQRGNSIY